MTEQQLTLDFSYAPEPESLEDELDPIDIALWSRIEAMSRAEIEARSRYKCDEGRALLSLPPKDTTKASLKAP